MRIDSIMAAPLEIIMNDRIVTRTTAIEMRESELSLVSGGTNKRTYFDTNIGPAGDKDWMADFDRDRDEVYGS